MEVILMVQKGKPDGRTWDGRFARIDGRTRQGRAQKIRMWEKRQRRRIDDAGRGSRKLLSAIIDMAADEKKRPNDRATFFVTQEFRDMFAMLKKVLAQAEKEGLVD
jgi:hypothetical protein